MREPNMIKLNVQLEGVTHPVQIEATSWNTDDQSFLTAKNDSAQIVGKFPLAKVLGWWINVA